MTNHDTAFSWIPRWWKARLVELTMLVLGGMVLSMFLNLWSLPSDLESHKAGVTVELSEFRDEISVFRVEVGGQIAELKVQNAELKAQNAELKSQFSEMMALLLEMREDDKRTQARQDDLYAEILTLSERSATNSARIEAHGKELQRHSAVIDGN